MRAGTVIYNKNIFFVVLCIVFFSVLRIPSLVEPNWYGDEGIYQVIGTALNQGRQLYTEIWDNKPPGLYYLYALVNGDLFLAKLLSLIAGALSIIPFFALSTHLFSKTVSRYTATLTYSTLFALPILEGNVANAENFMLLPVITALYIIFVVKRKKRITKSVLAGILLSIAFIIKIVAIFDLLTIVVARTVSRKRKNISLIKNIKQAAKENTFLVASFAILPAVISIYFFAQNATKHFINAIVGENIGYVEVENFYLFPMDILLAKISITFLAILLVTFLKINKKEKLIYIWLIFGILNATFSGRPYTHYLLNALPPFALLVGNIVENIKKTKALGISTALTVMVIVAAYTQFNIYKKNIAYYQNYIDYIFSDKTTSEYMAFFDKNTLRDYELARFLKSKSEQNVLILSDSGQLYTLSNTMPPGRYIVAYHITFYAQAIEETKKAIEENNPKYIILTKPETSLKPLLEGYEIRYRINGGSIYERI